ncbi:unnamed protein product [Phytophthora fragariaefolia]|uniref:Unnamed protein product n=1 Tax=Phytophthora fragariaefolia TaxID=1490495 RepID=A0A9W6TR01_9STRA|nr:unnamed protein product [Phytophthora fragariaefolia]
MNDIKAGGTHKQVFAEGSQGWDNVCYDANMQKAVDRQINTGIAPGVRLDLYWKARIWPRARISALDPSYWIIYGPADGAPSAWPRAVVTNHGQSPGNTTVSATVLVDDVVDVATTREGIESRVAMSDIFTGINATGGVFGSSKSFMLHYQPGRPIHEDSVYLNDGYGKPQPVTVVSPAEGFKHLGITQSTDKYGARHATGVTPAQKRCTSHHEVQTHIGSIAVYCEQVVGIGLTSFVDACNVSRIQWALRVRNAPHIPAYHLLVEGLEQYQILARLTCHPLELLPEPPPHLQGWMHQTIRAASRLGIHASVDWKKPSQCVSGRPNDRPIWNEMSKETQHKIMQFNLKYTWKIRFVGDLADASGCRRTPHNLDSLQMVPVDVAPNGLFVVRPSVVVQDRLELRGYELGQLIGDNIVDNELGFGHEIDVQWWHERRPGGDIWTVRPEGVATEYAALCVPVEVTPLIQHGRSRSAARVIIWQDTEVDGVKGIMEWALIQTAFTRSSQRFLEVMNTDEMEQQDRTCRGCNRLRDSQLCGRCGDWHHTNCRACTRDDMPEPRSYWTQCTYSNTAPLNHAAGEGSVIAGGTAEASGAWSIRTQNTRTIGRLQVHWKIMTSTRCECHALIASLATTGGSGSQVCGNQAAIKILQTARAIATGKRPAHIKYRNPHRVVIWSTVALIQAMFYIRMTANTYCVDNGTRTAGCAVTRPETHKVIVMESDPVHVIERCHSTKNTVRLLKLCAAGYVYRIKKAIFPVEATKSQQQVGNLSEPSELRGPRCKSYGDQWWLYTGKCGFMLTRLGG